MSLQLVALSIVVAAFILADSGWEFLGYLLGGAVAVALVLAPNFIPVHKDTCVPVGSNHDGRLGAWLAPDGHVLTIASTEDELKVCDLT